MPDTPEQDVKDSPELESSESVSVPVLKYSESLPTLKKLKETDESLKNRPESSAFKKGTADFIRRKIDTETGNDNYNSKAYEKSLADRFGQALGDSAERRFLPVEAFDPLLDLEEPTQAIQHFADPATGQTIGLSKWNFPNGDAELRECIVERFDGAKDTYEIRWLHNPELKKRVSRFNLIFKKED